MITQEQQRQLLFVFVCRRAGWRGGRRRAEAQACNSAGGVRCGGTGQTLKG